MLSYSSRGEASYRRLPGVCGQFVHTSVLSSALLQSGNTRGLHGAAVSCREGKAPVLAPITLLGDGLHGSLGVFLKDQALWEGVGCSLLSFSLWFASTHPWCGGSWVRTSRLTQLQLPPSTQQVTTTAGRAAGLEGAGL